MTYIIMLTGRKLQTFFCLKLYLIHCFSTTVPCFKMSYMQSAEYYLAFVLGILFTLRPWTGSSCLFGTEPGEGGIIFSETPVGMCEKRFSWCYPLSKMDRGKDTVSPAQLYPTAGCECELGDALFLSLSLFIDDSSAAARQKGQSGYCLYT